MLCFGKRKKRENDSLLRRGNHFSHIQKFFSINKKILFLTSLFSENQMLEFFFLKFVFHKTNGALGYVYFMKNE